MVAVHEDPTGQDYHPFWYAHIIGIFHVNICHMQSDGSLSSPQLLHFLWVCWFGKDPTYHAGPSAHHLDHIGFVTEDDDTEPFGFLNPAHVIRAFHAIPTFAHSHTTELMGPSIALHNPTEPEDWRYYYVNWFVVFFFLFQGLGTHHQQVCGLQHGHALHGGQHWAFYSLCNRY